MKLNRDHTPVVELDDVISRPRITKDGYYAVTIIEAKWNMPAAHPPKLWIKFEVSQGSCKGAWLQRNFFQTKPSIRSLSYLCAAVGINGELSDPQKLIGEELLVLVNLKKTAGKGWLIPEPNQFLPIEKP